MEGFIVALAGGALALSAVLELIEPATDQSSIWAVSIIVLVGATVFACLDYLVDEVWGTDSGGGLLMAITLDGIPENLALGIALVAAGSMQVATLSSSIFLSNFPEAAGSAKEMTDSQGTYTTSIRSFGSNCTLAFACCTHW